MGHFVYIALLGVFAISYSSGCDMGPNGGPWIPQTATIKDTFRGEMLSFETINIAGIANIGPAQNLNEGPYFGASLQGSTFTFFTIDSSFDDYEENETFNNTSLTVLFNCVGGTTRSLTIIIFITDTNNNAPIFIPSELEFTLIPPLPPGFSITCCFEDTVRDIDLTTQRIDFQIFDTTLFEITYDAESSTRPKEFKASLKTKTFIRTIPETIEFKISATDVDLTNDPQLTTYATVRIKSLEGGFELPDDPVFTQAYYLATYMKNHTVILDEPIALQQGYTEEVQFHLDQGTTRHFSIQKNGSEISLLVVTPLTEDFFDQRQIFLVINAEIENTSGANAAIIIELPEKEELKFEQPIYEGTIVDNILQLSQLVLSQGNPISVKVLSAYAEFFLADIKENKITLSMSPLNIEIVEQNTFLNLEVVAETNRSLASTIVTLEIIKDDYITPVFERAVYEGAYDPIYGLALDEIVMTQGYDDSVNVSLRGDHSSYFHLVQFGPVINVTVSSLPSELFREHNILLYIEATKPRTVGATTAILIALPEEEQPPPTVTFEGAPYVFSVENRHTGLVGQVSAAADNGEPVTYSLQVDNDHLRSRLSVDNTGALRLSAPGDRGVYDFQVNASTAFTQASAQTTVQLIVVEVPEGPTVCGDDKIVTSPLIIIDRDEEEEHRNLINLNNSELPGCHYTLTNRWPADQNWLYVNESGLHTTAIDREHPSISHMALSQVQVELNLVCDGDVTRTKRSLDRRLDWLGPYDYGTKTWVLTDSISFNPRRSIVNLIVNDINDNYPIFVGKDNEPIIVGYPSTDLEETVMPRSLAELQATDADVGENAALLYWSSEPEIAVSPTTGFVHVRAGAQLQENMMLTVHATDRNGEGLTGSISLMVKLLDSENIAVITVRDAFLEDESRILGNISNAIGYEVRALRSVIVSLSEEQTTRKKRNAPEPSGTSLEIYVYGLIQREPVAVETLSNDINSAAIVTIDIATILSLEDHLEGNEICVMPGRDAGLLVATIILSILLFILIIAAIVWLYLTRKKRENYDQFSDANSLASQNESAVQPPKPDFVTKPRLDIEELKRSERRLQDMLNAPIDEVSVEPMPSPSNKDAVNSVAKIPIPDLMAPIVIQDKLKDATADSDDGDEFGEVKKLPRRKSVVTFNENVEKIIHVEEEPEVSADPDYEVYKF